LYYRLKQVDYDGEFAYTEIRTVELGKIELSNALIKPNPFKEMLTIEVTEQVSTNAYVYLIDANGKEVRSFTLLLDKGTTTYQLTELDNLSSGMYFVHIVTENGNNYSIKAIKK
jgi:hypothetical protein